MRALKAARAQPCAGDSLADSLRCLRATAKKEQDVEVTELEGHTRAGTNQDGLATSMFRSSESS